MLTPMLVQWSVDGDKKYKSVETVLECGELVHDLWILGLKVERLYRPVEENRATMLELCSLGAYRVENGLGY